MTEIKGTNREFLEILKGLEAVKQAKGKTFAVLAARNIESISKHLKPIEKIATPKPEFVKLSREVQQLLEQENQEAVSKMEEDNKELINQRKEQLTKVEEMLDKKSTVNVNFIREEVVPEEITTEQLLPLLKIIKTNGSN
jgi:site-specific recombinase